MLVTVLCVTGCLAIAGHNKHTKYKPQNTNHKINKKKERKKDRQKERQTEGKTDRKKERKKKTERKADIRRGCPKTKINTIIAPSMITNKPSHCQPRFCYFDFIWGLGNIGPLKYYQLHQS